MGGGVVVGRWTTDVGPWTACGAGPVLECLRAPAERMEGTPLAEDEKLTPLSLDSEVRSFGTEDRPTDRPAPPREEIYEYIIFRGSDIKDITVCEPPKAQHTLPQDPAIVQVSVRLCSAVGTASRGAGFRAERGVLCLAAALRSGNSHLAESGLISVWAVGAPTESPQLSTR